MFKRFGLEFLLIFGATASIIKPGWSIDMSEKVIFNVASIVNIIMIFFPKALVMFPMRLLRTFAIIDW